jgi:SAM-dependent methyltransferase
MNLVSKSKDVSHGELLKDLSTRDTHHNPAMLSSNPESPDVHSSTDGYARRFSGSVGAWFLEVQERAFDRCLEQIECRSALDLGGGHGQVAIPLARRGIKVCTVVSSANAMGQLQKLLAKESEEVQSRISIVISDLFSPPVLEGEYDVVVSIRILSHLPEWREFLDTMCKFATKAVMFDYPSERSLNFFSTRLFKFKQNLEGNTRPFEIFKDRVIIEELRTKGYLVRATERQFFLPMVLHRFLDSYRLSRFAETVFDRIGLRRILGSPILLVASREGLQRIVSDPQ